MVTASVAATTLSAAGSTLGSFEPGFYLMILVLVGGAVSSITVAWQNHRRHR